MSLTTHSLPNYQTIIGADGKYEYNNNQLCNVEGQIINIDLSRFGIWGSYPQLRDGDIVWFSHGKLHRTDGPAADNGNKYWYYEGQLHRTDGPAIEFVNGDKQWYKHGKEHRIGGPSTMFKTGTQCWCQDGEFHRTDGPALISCTGKSGWFIRGKRVKDGCINEDA